MTGIRARRNTKKTAARTPIKLIFPPPFATRLKILTESIRIRRIRLMHAIRRQKRYDAPFTPKSHSDQGTLPKT